MNEFSKYFQDGKDIALLQDMYNGLVNYQCEMLLYYKDYIYKIDPEGESLVVLSYSLNMPHFEKRYETFEAFLQGFSIDGIPFVECWKDIDFVDN